MVITSPFNPEEWHNLPSPRSSLRERAHLPSEKTEQVRSGTENYNDKKKPLQSYASSLSNSITDSITVDWEAGATNKQNWDGGYKSAHATDFNNIVQKYRVDVK